VQCLADRTKLERGKEHTLLVTTPANKLQQQQQYKQNIFKQF